MASLNSNTPMTRDYMSLSLNPIYHSICKNLNNVSSVFTLGSVLMALPLTLTSPMPWSSALGSDHALFLLLPVPMSLAARFPSAPTSKFSVSLLTLSLNKHDGLLSKACYYHNGSQAHAEISNWRFRQKHLVCNCWRSTRLRQCCSRRCFSVQH